MGIKVRHVVDAYYRVLEIQITCLYELSHVLEHAVGAVDNSIQSGPRTLLFYSYHLPVYERELYQQPRLEREHVNYLH